ncbi:MAG: hypothetical protein VXZ82_03515 [Planctomycetota bacterium]|nr:hypothetical protein [Planctomycetota bacterium]
MTTNKRVDATDCKQVDQVIAGKFTADFQGSEVMDRFFWSLKHEWKNYETYSDMHEAGSSMLRYI